MKRVISLVFTTLQLLPAVAQKERKLSTYLFTQYSRTFYDQTKPNNPWAIGLGVQAHYNNPTKFKPMVDLTADLFLEDDKVFRIDLDEKPLDDVRGMINFLVGTAFQPVNTMYLSFVAGPSFSNGRALLGIKPSVGVYFLKNQRLTAKISYLNVFDRGKTSKQDFGAASLAIGLKIF